MESCRASRRSRGRRDHGKPAARVAVQQPEQFVDLSRRMAREATLALGTNRARMRPRIIVWVRRGWTASSYAGCQGRGRAVTRTSRSSIELASAVKPGTCSSIPIPNPAGRQFCGSVATRNGRCRGQQWRIALCCLDLERLSRARDRRVGLRRKRNDLDHTLGKRATSDCSSAMLRSRMRFRAFRQRRADRTLRGRKGYDFTWLLPGSSVWPAYSRSQVARERGPTRSRGRGRLQGRPVIRS